MGSEREFTRVGMRIPVHLVSTEGVELSGTAENVSLGGMFLKTPTPLRVGTECQISLFLGPRAGGPKLVVQGTVARATDAGIGVTLETLNFDSLEQLRYLVLANAPAPDIVQSEETTLRGQRPHARQE